MPQHDFPAADERRATSPRIDRSDGPHDDPPPAAPRALAVPASTAPADETAPSSTWPIVIVYQDGGALFVITAQPASEPFVMIRELVVACVDRVGRVRSTHCTCAFFGREGTCTHVWEASFELASQRRACS